MSNIYKVTNVSQNNLDSEKILNALVLREVGIEVSVPFICERKYDDTLCSKTNIKLDKNNYYINGCLIDKNMKLKSITERLMSCLENLKNKEKDNTDYSITMIRDILKDNILPEVEMKTQLSIEDIINSLYGLTENGGRKK